METQPATLGEVLRVRRQELGLSLAEIAKKTCISRAYLNALEEDRPEVFPAETYRNGFLRTYAGALGLKMSDLPAQESLPSVAEPRVIPLAAVDPPSSSGKSVFAAMVAILLVFAAIFSASVFRTTQEPPAAASKPLIADRVSMPEKKAFPFADEIRASVTQESEPHLSAEGASHVSPAEAASEVVSVAALSPSKTAVPPAASEQQPQTFSARQETVTNNVITLRALGPNRLELTLDNRPPRRYELKAETELSWRLRHSAHIRVDNPSSVELWFGGELLDMKGKSQMFLEARPEPGGQRS